MKNKFLKKLVVFVLAFTMCAVNCQFNVFASEDPLKTNKTTYVYGESVSVTATYEEEGAFVAVYEVNDEVSIADDAVQPYFWYLVNGSVDNYSWENGVEYILNEQLMGQRTGDEFLPVGEYKVVLVDAQNQIVDEDVITVI